MRLKIKKTGSFKNSKKYIKLIENASVYDVAVNTPITFAPNLSAKEKNKIYATGGRVLNFTSISDNFLQARDNVHENIKKLDWNGGFYRKDIGFKVID